MAQMYNHGVSYSNNLPSSTQLHLQPPAHRLTDPEHIPIARIQLFSLILERIVFCSIFFAFHLFFDDYPSKFALYQRNGALAQLIFLHEHIRSSIMIYTVLVFPLRKVRPPALTGSFCTQPQCPTQWTDAALIFLFEIVSGQITCQ